MTKGSSQFMTRRFLGILFLLIGVLPLAGCAHARAESRLWAQADPPICKHCNCYMPAHFSPEEPCAVCKCGYSSGHCIRGK